jgi:hypothetical protein
MRPSVQRRIGPVSHLSVDAAKTEEAEEGVEEPGTRVIDLAFPELDIGVPVHYRDEKEIKDPPDEKQTQGGKIEGWPVALRLESVTPYRCGREGEEMMQIRYIQKENIMKYICLGYLDEDHWDAMTESEREARLDECFSYDDKLRENGHFAGGEALESANIATTLRWQNGKVSITDGPYAETKEQLGGILILEARDLNHAIRLISEHPGVKMGPFEIRPAADLSDMVAASERRRASKKEK